jgi:hypothetical protein
VFLVLQAPRSGNLRVCCSLRLPAGQLRLLEARVVADPRYYLRSAIAVASATHCEDVTLSFCSAKVCRQPAVSTAEERRRRGPCAVEASSAAAQDRFGVSLFQDGPAAASALRQLATRALAGSFFSTVDRSLIDHPRLTVPSQSSQQQQELLATAPSVRTHPNQPNHYANLWSQKLEARSRAQR